LGLKKRELALYLAFLELVLGSFGYLLSINISGAHISLRYAFFAVIMVFWIYDVLRGRFRARSKTAKALAIFLIFWIFGIVSGYARGYNPSDIFFDANGYLYLLMFLPAITYINTREKLLWLSKTLFMGICVLTVFSLGLFIIFAKSQSAGTLEILYKWVRDFRLGEITPLKNGIYRIFLQSQIYLLPGIFLIFIRNWRRKISRLSFVIWGPMLSAAIYICLSRSLWIGFAAGIIILAVLMVYLKIDKKILIKRGVEAAAAVAIGVLAIGLFIPKDASLLFGRFQIGESASDTRMAELAPLFFAIKAHPVLGYGFGKTLTFTSFDPRVGGQPYTSYAFEWGYLDMILKFGLLGLATYLYFIWAIIRQLFRELKKEPFYNLWALASLAALLAVHIFTPYLNHPLGIGILILAGVAAEIDMAKKS